MKPFDRLRGHGQRPKTGPSFLWRWGESATDYSLGNRGKPTTLEFPIITRHIGAIEMEGFGAISIFTLHLFMDLIALAEASPYASSHSSTMPVSSNAFSNTSACGTHSPRPSHLSPGTGYRLNQCPRIAFGQVRTGSPTSNRLIGRSGQLGRKIMPRRP